MADPGCGEKRPIEIVHREEDTPEMGQFEKHRKSHDRNRRFCRDRDPANFR